MTRPSHTSSHAAGGGITGILPRPRFSILRNPQQVSVKGERTTCVAFSTVAGVIGRSNAQLEFGCA